MSARVCNLHTMQRINIVISDQQLADLREVAELEQSSVSAVVRDCIRAVLPQLVAVTRFTRDPSRSNAELLQFADQMEAALDTVAQTGLELLTVAQTGVERLQGAAEAATGGAADPASPPSSNTGAHS